MAGERRGFKQANVALHVPELSRMFWFLVVVVGILAGVGAMLMMEILRTVQHLAFSYRTGSYSTAVAQHSDVRRVAILALGGIFTGLAIWLMKRFWGDLGGEPTAVVWDKSGSLSLGRSLASGALSEVTVGLGASLGREAAPQRLGAACADFLGRHFHLSTEQRTILIAYGAGAGLAAVYNVPLAGTVFALELYLGTFSLSIALPAFLASGIATAVSWLLLPPHAVYHVPHLPSPTLAVLGFSLVVGPIMGLLGAVYIHLVVWAHDHQPRFFLLILEPLLVFTVLGFLAIRYPLLLGNGRDLVQYAYTGRAGLITLVALMVLKPLVTVGSLRSGATGGLFTPTLSFGAVAGALFGNLWLHLWPGAPLAVFSVIGSAALLGSALEAPVTAVLFVVELTHTVDAVMVPMVVAIVGATLTARRLDLRSIYSARLPRPDRQSAPQATSHSS